MITCPICGKEGKSMDLAKHIIYPTGNIENDLKHKTWLDGQNLDLSKEFKPLADLLETMGESK